MNFEFTDENALEDMLKTGKHTQDGLEGFGLTYLREFRGDAVYNTNEGHYAYFNKEMIEGINFYTLINYVVSKE